jgi:hypothetical protein
MARIPKPKRASIRPAAIGNVPIPMSLAEQPDISRGLVDMGQAIFNIGLEKQRVIDQTELTSASSKLDQFEFDYQKQIRDKQVTSGEDLDALYQGYQTARQQIIDNLSTKINSRVRDRFKQVAESSRVPALAAVDKDIFDKRIPFQQTEFVNDYASALQRGDTEGAKSMLEVNRQWFDPSTGKSIDDVAAEIENNIAKAKILDNAMQAGSKEAGLDVLMSSNLSWEDKSSLDDKIIDLYNAKEAGDKKTRYNESLSIYNNFIPMINEGNLKLDTIESSNLQEEEKVLWREYVKGSHVEPLDESTASGYDMLLDTVLNYSKDKGTKEAIESILGLKYESNIISDEDYKWAMSKLNNPYPKPLVSKIRGMLDATKEQTRSFWDLRKTELAKAKDINKSILEQNITQDLFDWIDKQEKEPTGKEIYQHLTDTRISYNQLERKDNSGYELNQIINKGGKRWIIVDFDVDGEPLVEEAQ